MGWLVRPVALLALVTAMAFARIEGEPWRGIVMPNQMRVLEAREVQYESETMFRTTRAMVSNQTIGQIYETSSFMTDDYRAILPIGTAAVGTNLLGSWYWGSVFSDVAWWWAGAWATATLAALAGASPIAAFLAGGLAAVGPLGVGYIGSGNLHAASSLSLPIYLLLAWKILDRHDLGTITRGVGIGVIAFLSSITYTYQWVLFPVLGAMSLRPSMRRWRLPLPVALATFGIATYATRAALDAVGLGVAAHMNDPLRVVSGRLDDLHAVVADPFGHVVGICRTAWSVAIDTLWAYHPIVAVLGVLGMVRGPRILRALGACSAILAFAQGLVYNVPWVTMTAFPAVYASVGVALDQAAQALAKACRRRGWSVRSARLAGFAVALGGFTIAAGATNLDLVGIDAYVIRWWGTWYVPH